MSTHSQKHLFTNIKLNSLKFGGLVNIGSANGLLHDETKPLHEPMMTYH